MSTIKEYLSELSGRRVTVIGMGVSNIPLIKMLLRAGVEVTVRDRSPRERLAEQAQELESLGARLILGENYLKDLPEELIFRTPGWRCFSRPAPGGSSASLEATERPPLPPSSPSF